MARDQANDSDTWIVDSGAYHHITSDLQILSLHSDYGGNEDIMIGDGNSIPITHVGSTTIEAPTTICSLDIVLCAPLIKKNLLSISQFCHQNNTSIEFFPDFFIVKDLSMWASLVQGRNKGNVYKWPTSSTAFTTKPHAFLTNKPTMKSQHCSFGHPSSQVLTKLVSTQALPVSAPRILSSHCDS